MGKNTREEETKLLDKIILYKKEFREIIMQKFLNETKEKQKTGEVFFRGNWVPQDKLEELQRIFSKRDRTVSIETLILILISFGLNLLILGIFIRQLLP